MKLPIAKRKRRRRKKCPFCGGLFFPSPKMKNRQWACSKPECQRLRHAQNCRNWWDKNFFLYLDRYEEIKDWLKDNHKYLKKRLLRRCDTQDSVIGVPFYISPTCTDLKMSISKTAWIMAARSVFCRHETGKKLFHRRP